MNTTSIPIPADLVAQLQQAAHSQGVPIEEFVAASLETALRRAQPRDPLFADDAIFTGPTPADLASPTPADEWERQLRSLATDCGVSLSHEALSSEGLYEKWPVWWTRAFWCDWPIRQTHLIPWPVRR